jgi:hypothetical protein
MVNDDKPFLRITSDAVLAYGSPWSGKHGLATNICVPLKGICSLRRGKENQIWCTDANELMDLLSRQVHLPEDEGMAQKARSLLEQMTQMVHLWQMECNKDPDAARVAHAAMSGEPDKSESER